MDDAQLGKLESEILLVYMPGINKSYRKALRKLCKEKRVKIFSPELLQDLTNLLGSIIRHKETNYDSMVKAVGKTKARFYVQPMISQGLSDAL